MGGHKEGHTAEGDACTKRLNINLSSAKPDARHRKSMVGHITLNLCVRASIHGLCWVDNQAPAGV